MARLLRIASLWSTTPVRVPPSRGSAKAGALPWTRFGTGPGSDLVPTTFQWSKGEHNLRIQVNNGQAATIRLLATTDPGADLPPSLSPVEDQWVAAGKTLVVPFFITATGNEIDRSVVRVTSDNPDLLGKTNIWLKQSGTDYTLTLTTAPSRSGFAHIQITVSDPLGRIANEQFAVTVLGQVQALVQNAPPGGHVIIPPGTSLEKVVISKDLTLEGAGVGQTIIDGGGSGPTFIISANCTVHLAGVTIRNGSGAGLQNYGSLWLTSSSVVANRGPGIQNRGALVLDHVSLQDSHASQGGGLDNTGTATLNDCRIMNNSSTGGGGGVVNRKGATLLCESCCIALNQTTPASGGGIWNIGTLTVRNCTIASNSATAVLNRYTAAKSYNGGGIMNAGLLQLQSTTICANQATSDGGGLRNTGEAEVINTLIAGNSSLTTTAADVSGTLSSGGHNLIQSPAGITLIGGSGDTLGADARLDVLRNNGGPTETVALLPDSPAIDAGDNSASPAVDQRGLPRPAGGAADIGAFEYQPGPTITEARGANYGTFQLEPNQRYIVEGSTDLMQWTAFGVYTADSHGRLQFIDACSGCATRFYRAQLDPARR